MALWTPRVIDDRGQETPLARGHVVVTWRDAGLYLVVALWVGLVWSPDYVPSAPAFLGTVALLGALHAAGHVFFAPRVVRLARRRGVCASCDYDLTGISAETDGCTVCPECGAAWRVS